MILILCAGLNSLLVKKWYFKFLPIIIPMEYFCFRIYGQEGFRAIFIHLLLIVLPLLSYYIEKFYKE